MVEHVGVDIRRISDAHIHIAEGEAPFRIERLVRRVLVSPNLYVVAGPVGIAEEHRADEEIDHVIYIYPVGHVFEFRVVRQVGIFNIRHELVERLFVAFDAVV